MKLKKPKVSNIIFLTVIVILIIPQTRLPIQVFLHKGLALFSPSTISEEERMQLADYSWSLQSLDGVDHEFENSKGKVIILNFWATWCPPCIAEMPAFHELYTDYVNKVDFLFVSSEKETTIRKFMSKHEYTFDILRPMSDIPKALEARSIPRTYIIDKKGHIVIDKTGAANWNSNEVRETLDRLIAQ